MGENLERSQTPTLSHVLVPFCSVRSVHFVRSVHSVFFVRSVHSVHFVVPLPCLDPLSKQLYSETNPVWFSCVDLAMHVANVPASVDCCSDRLHTAALRQH